MRVGQSTPATNGSSPNHSSQSQVRQGLRPAGPGFVGHPARDGGCAHNARMNTRKQFLIGALAAAITSSTVRAADPPRCNELFEDAQRLACYDAVFGKPLRPLVSPAAPLAPAASAAAPAAAVIPPVSTVAPVAAPARASRQASGRQRRTRRRHAAASGPGGGLALVLAACPFHRRRNLAGAGSARSRSAGRGQAPRRQ